MSIELNGTTGITTPDVTSSGSLNIDASAPDDSLVVDASGNVGMGVTPSTYSQGKALDIGSNVAVWASGGGNVSLFNANFNSGYKYKTSDVASMYVMGASHQWFTAPSGTAGSAISFTQAMTLDSSGNLLVGTTSSVGTNPAKIEVFNSGGARLIQTKTDVNSNTNHLTFNTASGQAGSIYTNTLTTSYVTSSDYRLKENWQPMTGASERVKALKPVNFAWKVNGERVDGFLAHEAQAVVPEAVTGEKDAVDAEGNPVYQGIDQSKLVPLLTAALQEALAKIDEQKAALDVLTARVSALEAANV